jgi:hypothetical protein
MNLAFILIGYYLCGEQPDVIRLKLEECKPLPGIEGKALASIGIEQTEQQLAQTQIVQTRHVDVDKILLFSTSEGCDVARMTAQRKSDELNAYLLRSIRSGDFWHSQHWKCVELKVR